MILNQLMEARDVDFENHVQDDSNNHISEEYHVQDDTNNQLVNFIEPNLVDVEEPKVGMTFTSIDEAYKFYFTYAGRKGFNARKFHNKKTKRDL